MLVEVEWDGKAINMYSASEKAQMCEEKSWLSVSTCTRAVGMLQQHRDCAHEHAGCSERAALRERGMQMEENQN
jgi:hypothetical protein